MAQGSNSRRTLEAAILGTKASFTGGTSTGEILTAKVREDTAEDACGDLGRRRWRGGGSPGTAQTCGRSGLEVLVFHPSKRPLHLGGSPGNR